MILLEYLLVVSLLVVCHGQCPYNETALKISNGSISNTSNIYITTTNLGTYIAYGYLEYACASGYTFNSSIGNRIICYNNGSWSTLPMCQYMDRCPTAPLFKFLLNRFTLISMTFNGNHSLPRNGSDNSYVPLGTFVPMVCKAGHVNAGGPLNITCVNGSWTPFPICMLPSGNVPGLMMPNIGTPCPADFTTFSIENGSMSDISYFQLPMDTTHSGWAYFDCWSNYTLDPTIGPLYICVNGAWSPKPRCLKIDRCPLSSLTILLSTTTGLQTTDQVQLMRTSDDATVVLNGSYAVFSCRSGYTNTGGSLNVTCNGNSTWSAFPNCVKNGDAGSITTTVGPETDARCPVTSVTFFVPYGFLTNTTRIILYEDYTASGWVMFGCPAGFAIDPVTNGILTCKNGIWSSRPRCLRTARCFYFGMRSLNLNVDGLESDGPSHMLPTYDDSNVWVPDGSYALFRCKSGYTNIGGSLNVTCNPGGRWSPSPLCVPLTQMAVVALTNASTCPYSSSLTTISNGYARNLNVRMVSNANQAESGSFVDYLCMPPYTLSGNTRMTCVNGVWSAKPMCIISNQVNTTITTTLSPLPCVGKPSIPNAYVSNDTLINSGNNYYQGQIQFKCNVGHRFVNTSSVGWITCINGIWSTLPVCEMSPVCSVSELQSALVNVKVVSSSFSTGANGGVLAGGWIQVQCASNFNLSPGSGSLNITCQETGKWTRFPVCS